MTSAAARVRPRLPSVAWLAPLAYALHVAEETSAGFPDWMRERIAPGFTTASFVTVNTVVMATLLTLTACVSVTGGRVGVWPYFALASALMLWNALVHVGATLYFGSYAPGVATALLVYLPAFAFLVRTATRDGVLPTGARTTALATGAALHAALGLALAAGAFSR